MKLFKSKIEKMRSKVLKDNLPLLEEVDDNCDNYEHYLEKLLAWQEDFDWVGWQEFYENWHYCNICKDYSEEQCICYAR